MKKIIILIVLIISVISLFVYMVVTNSQYEETEYVPEVEITDDELRNTIITLYFENKENGEIRNRSKTCRFKKSFK